MLVDGVEHGHAPAMSVGIEAHGKGGSDAGENAKLERQPKSANNLVRHRPRVRRKRVHALVRVHYAHGMPAHAHHTRRTRLDVRSAPALGRGGG